MTKQRTMSTRAVHKFALLLGSENRIEMDQTAGILHVGMQGHLLMLWAVVDTEAPKFTRTFKVFGTGELISDGWLPIGTCFDGPFVWHVFELLVRHE